MIALRLSLFPLGALSHGKGSDQVAHHLVLAAG